RIHPDFCAIFTSNPQEYAGVHKAQDALMDRMLTIRLDHYDQETEIAIAQAKSGISRQDAEKIVGTVKEMRKNGHDSMPTVRASIMIAKVLKVCGAQAAPRDPIFIQTCKDALESRVATDGSGVEMGRGGPRGR
ncbi:MAG: gas vesicle protein GvpN, partial [Thermodesulfobacteriota bacterium]